MRSGSLASKNLFLYLNTDFVNNFGFGNNFSFIQLPSIRADSGKTKRLAINDESLFYEVWNGNTLENSTNLLNLQAAPSFKFARLDLITNNLSLSNGIEKIITFNHVCDNVNTSEWVSSFENSGITIKKAGYYLLVINAEIYPSPGSECIAYYVCYKNGNNLLNVTGSNSIGGGYNINIRTCVPIYLESGSFISANCILHGASGYLLIGASLGLIPLSF